MELTGEMLIAGERVAGAEPVFKGVDPASRREIGPAFGSASAADVDRACTAAGAAFAVYRNSPLELRAQLLELIADNILALGDALVERVMAETGLPRGRVEGERGRTMGQLRLFAQTVRDGGWMDVRIDPAQPDRQPAPKPDLRLRKIGLGPVAVFGASNFPLAFSVAGGDTASALAAGCPVVAKAHPAHPGTSELVGTAIAAAVETLGLPAGTFSLLFGAGNAVGEALVRHPAIKAVGFTGSRGGGTALIAIASARSEPIPVFAEMSSLNPVLLFPGALAKRGEQIAREFAASLNLGVGQFCTNPGLLIALDDDASTRFEQQAAEAVGAAEPGVMLTAGICSAYETGTAALAGHKDVRTAGGRKSGVEAGRAAPALFATSGQVFDSDPALQEEVFGPSSLMVRCADLGEMRRVLTNLEGQLTVALHIEPEDHDLVASLMPLLEERAGRILVNGFGTGVEVSPAMVHGGPWPSTSDPRFTSVGTLAIDRFLRPVCYQDFPADLLPEALRG